MIVSTKLQLVVATQFDMKISSRFCVGLNWISLEFSIYLWWNWIWFGDVMRYFFMVWSVKWLESEFYDFTRTYQSFLDIFETSIHRQNEGDSDKWSNNEFADDNKKNKCVNEPELMTHWVLGRSSQHDQVLCYVSTAMMMCSVIECWWNFTFHAAVLHLVSRQLCRCCTIAYACHEFWYLIYSISIWFRFIVLVMYFTQHIYIRFVHSRQAFFFFPFFSIYQRVISTQFQSHGLALECISYKLRLCVYFC